MSFTYTRDIPDPPSSPSVDVPNMKVNTNSIDDIWAVDHFRFSALNAGRHKQVTLTNEAAPGFVGGNGTLYANLATGQSWPFWQNALGSFQILGQQSIATPGYLTLPGGLIIQWGTDTKNTGGSVTFPLNPFPNAIFGVLCTILENNNNRHFVFVKSQTTAGFTVASRDSSGSDEANTFFWLAIGN